MEDLGKQVQEMLQKLKVEDKRKKIRENEVESTHPTFWNNHQTAADKMRELAKLQKEVEKAEYLSMLVEEGEYEEAEKILSELEFYLYLSGLYDKYHAILSIHAGQGGVDAMDWTSMLHRMYTRYFDKKGWRYEVIDETSGEEAGLKNVSILVEGEYAYGYLKGEQGVHRLVRLSPFNADKLRHTSFALVEVLPQIEEVEGFDIREDDVEWEFFRASSHGGQNVQKVSTAVRVRHKPSGIVVTCQTERYQAQNRENALKLLRAKLWARSQDEKKEQEKKLRGAYKAPSWGNQIRSYVLHPYQMVKDLRTNVETSNTEKVLDGDIHEFIEAELKI